MPSLFARLLAAICCLFVLNSQAVEQVPVSMQAANTILLDDRAPTLQIATPTDIWLDEGSHASIELVASGIVKFKSEPALARHALNKYDTLWIKLRLQRAPGSKGQWTLNLPMPVVDEATLYQTDISGLWTTQRAGDTVAQGEWHRKGLYPDFDIYLTDNTPKDVYLQVRNFRHVSIPIHLTAKPQRESQRQIELLTLGLTLGVLLSLAALSLMRFAEHRQSIDGWAALFGLLIATTLAQINGVLNAFVWKSMPEIGDYASSFVPVIAVGSTLLFIRNVFALHVHFHRFDRFLSSVGWGTLASALVFGVMDRYLADGVSSMVMIFAAVMGLGATLLSWYNGTAVGRWLVLALLPQFFAMTYMLAETLGYAPLLWQIRYVTTFSVAISVPILLYALSQLTHDRKELVVRANHLPTQDALTGLLTPAVFQSHLEGAVQRAIDHREPLALVVVRVTNHEHIRMTYSDTTAEQCLLRAVVKLQRILRDVDPAGRVGTAQFGLLMEGVKTRQALTERMVKLIGSGLIPLPGLVPEVTLHFQAACVLLHENPLPPERALDDLRELLAGMSPNTRRPIRFLEPAPTQASQLDTPAPAV